MRAAVANGADAIYFGLEEFNARRRATNFTLAGLPGVMGYLHRHNVKGYVAFNTLVFSDELDRAAAYVRGVIEAGADALIVQDLGIAALIRRMSPTFPIHASTQTTQTHPEGMAVLTELGVSRVILARELSLADIGKIASQTALELEVFAHGALCISYSGQCLASESLWGRSGNRGLCGQACRLPYRLVMDGREEQKDQAEYLLSPHDLAAYSRIPELMQAGVTSFKIEGRLKGGQYVASVVRIYREAMDAAIRGQAYALSPEREEELAQSFSRGFTCGFLDGPRHQELIGYGSPKSRGIRIGTVVSSNNRGVVVRLDRPDRVNVKPGDGVVFETSRADVEEQGGRVYSVSPIRDRNSIGHDTVELTFGRGDLDTRRVVAGSGIFKSDDPAVGRRIESTYARDQIFHPVPVTASVTAADGERLLLVLSDDDGHEVRVRSDEPTAPAQRHPLTRELLREQLARLGDSPFKLKTVHLFDGGAPGDGEVESVPVMVPKSVLNHLRRLAVQELDELRQKSAKHVISAADALEAFRRDAAGTLAAGSSTSTPIVHVLARDLEQFEVAAELVRMVSAASTVYADLPEKTQYAEAVAIARRAGVRVGLATPQVLHPGEEHLLHAIGVAGPDVLLVRNLTALRYFRRELPGVDMVGDFSLNLANELSAEVLLSRGLSRLTPGYDLNLNQFESLLARVPAVDFELIVHAHLPMFLTAHCPTAARLSAGNDCRACGQPCMQHRLHLQDRNGEKHPLRVDAAGRSTVFNAVPQSIVPVWSRVCRMAFRHWRIELVDEPAAEIRASIPLYVRLAQGDESASTELRKINTRARAGTLEHA